MSAEQLPIPQEDIENHIDDFLAAKLGEIITDGSVEDL